MSGRLRASAPLLRAAYGQLAREERERRGLSRSAVAERAGLRVAQVREIENGRTNCNIFAYDALARLGLERSFAALVAAAEEEEAALVGQASS